MKPAKPAATDGTELTHELGKPCGVLRRDTEGKPQTVTMLMCMSTGLGRRVVDVEA
jgi:hypothetical protein